ncbi:hypothetical protein RND71_008820 [Anisodus tanguticus]|uniref:Uncharacterized protein n=1 Tax=Anisodus tanguticus TaxID=243964 RepID=A0AAE1VR22_9SOLA|nr:hypothetical protein RND71_008820 [Anisodus tanguticus]
MPCQNDNFYLLELANFSMINTWLQSQIAYKFLHIITNSMMNSQSEKICKIHTTDTKLIWK